MFRCWWRWREDLRNEGAGAQHSGYGYASAEAAEAAVIEHLQRCSVPLFGQLLVSTALRGYLGGVKLVDGCESRSRSMFLPCAKPVDTSS